MMSCMWHKLSHRNVHSNRPHVLTEHREISKLRIPVCGGQAKRPCDAGGFALRSTASFALLVESESVYLDGI